MGSTLTAEKILSTNNRANNKRMLCRSHPDFHIPADIVVGEGFDGETLGRQLYESGADSIAIFAKCHYGHAYYPTEIGTPHPLLQCDLLGEAVKGCNKHGVSVTAYLSVFYDSAAVAKHPEWILQSEPSDAASSLEADNYAPTCVNSGYIEEDLIPQSIEVVEKYAVDELFYDTMTRFRPCFYQKCHIGFGKEIPADDNHDNWPEFVVWYRKCFDDAFIKITHAIKAAKPDVGVIFNWKWGVREPTAPPAGIDHLSSDYWGSGSISSYHGRYYASTGLTYDYMCGRFRHGL
ncbi:MAG: alpha-L-fucosidase, partial [Planctomycetes bacterium]|nr:alpha-L-fucosidase [Planctomycetota bacterium]